MTTFNKMQKVIFDTLWLHCPKCDELRPHKRETEESYPGDRVTYHVCETCGEIAFLTSKTRK